MYDSKLTILILTASFGNGHKSVAHTIGEEFNKTGYADTIICDLYKESHPLVNSVSKQAYLKSYDFGYLYSLYYNGIEKLAHSSFGFWYRQLGKDYLKELIFNVKPDIIINTFPVMVSSEIKKKYSLEIPIYSIITDYCVHKIWLNDSINKYYIAHKDLVPVLKDWGIKNNQIEISGIPIDNAFESSNPQKSFEIVRKKYGISDDRIILINAGAFGVMKDITNICNRLDELDNVQSVVICGNNDKLRDDLEKSNYNHVKPLGYINDVHHFYNISHCLITKPGGITLSEASSCCLPLILYNPVPGQELHNATLFEKKGAAIIAMDEDGIYNGVIDLLNKPRKLYSIRNALNNMYQKGSARRIVEDILNQIDEQNKSAQLLS